MWLLENQWNELQPFSYVEGWPFISLTSQERLPPTQCAQVAVMWCSQGLLKSEEAKQSYKKGDTSKCVFTHNNIYVMNCEVPEKSPLFLDLMLKAKSLVDYIRREKKMLMTPHITRPPVICLKAPAWEHQCCGFNAPQTVWCHFLGECLNTNVNVQPTPDSLWLSCYSTWSVTLFYSLFSQHRLLTDTRLRRSNSFSCWITIKWQMTDFHISTSSLLDTFGP